VDTYTKRGAQHDIPWHTNFNMKICYIKGAYENVRAAHDDANDTECSSSSAYPLSFCCVCRKEILDLRETDALRVLTRINPTFSSHTWEAMAFYITLTSANSARNYIGLHTYLTVHTNH